MERIKQIELIKKSVTEWNQVWVNNPFSANLRDADLSGANLRSADLRSAYLRSANLRSADLSDADLSGADLRSANLRSANLSSVDLRSANLRSADLRSAYLRGANLSDADLSGAYLRGANLSDADLSGAYLSGANLSDADLSSAYLSSVDLPAPTMMLLCNWGWVSDELCADLMRYDAENCPNGKELFYEWAKGGNCPYSDLKIERAANFQERRELYKPGRARSALDLMISLIREKCKDSDYHDGGE